MSEDKINRLGMKKYNHISNGGFIFKTYIENDVQYLNIEMLSLGVSQSFSIMLNDNTIDSLLTVLEHAKLERESTNLNGKYTYLNNLPEPSCKSHLEEKCASASIDKTEDEYHPDHYLSDSQVPVDEPTKQDSLNKKTEAEPENETDALINFLENLSEALDRRFTKIY